MGTQLLELLLVLTLTLMFLSLLAELDRIDASAASKTLRRRSRPLRPRCPDDCPHCSNAHIQTMTTGVRPVIPYGQCKSRRGRRKTIDTHGQDCPNPNCAYYGITASAVHAIVGYGHHGHNDLIQDYYCQACHRKFSARRHTALYRLKTPPARVAQVLHAIAEGLSVQAAARDFQLSETSIRTWISRAGQHSQSLHDRLMRTLQLPYVQLDELRLKVYGMAEAVWRWVACDARTKIIPAYTLGLRTQAKAHQLVHEVARRLAPCCVPVFSGDGLALYFYALTAHFGEWSRSGERRRRQWLVSARLLYAQVIKRYRRHRMIEVRHEVHLGNPAAYRQALCTHGFSGRIQTAFIERLNLTIRRSIAGLARRSWSAPHSPGELTLHFEWWRAVYHFARPHHSLRQPFGSPLSPDARQRFRPWTPAQAAGLSHHRWTVLEVLSFPMPPLPPG